MVLAGRVACSAEERPHAPARRRLRVCFASLLGLLAGLVSLRAAAGDEPRSRCFALELYMRGSDPGCWEAREMLTQLAAQRPGIGVRTYDLEQQDASARLQSIGRYFGIAQPALPLVYGCQQPIQGFGGAAAFRQRLEAMLTMTVYVRSGCPRCARAREYLPGLGRRYPALRIKLVDIVSDGGGAVELQKLAQHYRTAAVSVPVFHFCNQLVVGFDSAHSTGARLDAILARWTYDCPAAKTNSKTPGDGNSQWPHMPLRRILGARFGTRGQSQLAAVAPRLLDSLLTAERESEDRPPLPLPPLGVGDQPPPDVAPPTVDSLPPSGPPAGAPAPELPLPGSTDPPWTGDEPSQDAPAADSVELPVFGRLSASHLGLPLFTLAIGLIDGFNPCAMWVLLFLLSVLVNLQDRWKIVAVAGTFVLISGLAYFAFMAAWLNVLTFVGLLRPVQVTLALLALAIGAIHIKDFFAFRRGVTLSIPEAAKPGIYARVRRIVTAENLSGAILGAAVLAVLVNLIELLCTAGLPALYTQILALHELSKPQNYLYLALYNLAYMADDLLMVTLVVVTLSRRKVQETHGRWLKLVSGVVIASLGAILLVRPELLV